MSRTNPSSATWPSLQLRGSAVLLSAADPRFRTEEELRSSLGDAGFVVDRIYGGWARQPVGEGDGEFLVVARA